MIIELRVSVEYKDALDVIVLEKLAFCQILYLPQIVVVSAYRAGDKFIPLVFTPRYELLNGQFESVDSHISGSAGP